DEYGINVVGDIVTNIQDEGAVYTEITQLIDDLSGSDSFVDNGDGTFTHTAVDGTAVTFDANTATLTDNGDGTYTLVNANGTEVTIDVAGDVVENIVNEGAVYNELTRVINELIDT